MLGKGNPYGAAFPCRQILTTPHSLDPPEMLDTTLIGWTAPLLLPVTIAMRMYHRYSMLYFVIDRQLCLILLLPRAWTPVWDSSNSNNLWYKLWVVCATRKLEITRNILFTREIIQLYFGRMFTHAGIKTLYGSTPHTQTNTDADTNILNHVAHPADSQYKSLEFGVMRTF